jgi:hypothetical protein
LAPVQCSTGKGETGTVGDQLFDSNLQWNFNKIDVRSFMLMGAPIIDAAQQNASDNRQSRTRLKLFPASQSRPHRLFATSSADAFRYRKHTKGSSIQISE